MTLNEALKHAINGNAMLFIGSGFSVGATSLEGKEFPTGKQLARRLYKECGMMPPDDDLYYAAQRYRRKFDDDSLVTLLQRLFTTKIVSENQKRFSEIPWTGIFTTNYDDVLETAFSSSPNPKKLKPITIDQDTNLYTSRRNCCVHINGYIDDLTRSSFDNSFKLTNTSYLTEEFSKSNWSFIFRKALESSRAIIFVGYSMYDLDIGRILYADKELKDKTIFIEWEGASSDYLENSIQNEFGEIFPVGLSGFWDAYDKIASSYIPEDNKSTLLSFSELSISEKAQPMRDDDAFNFLLKGEINLNFIWNGAISNGRETAFIKREQHDHLIDQIDSGEKVIVVTSDMANGKTVFSLGLCCSLIARNFRVFKLNENVEKPYEDINKITALDGKIAIIIENYTRHFEELKYIYLRKNGNIVLILTTKTVFQESFREKLSTLVGAAQEISLDKLSDSDIEKFSILFSTYKLWAKNDAWPLQRKNTYIKEKCGREVGACLLGIVKSPEIATRFRVLFEAFGKNDNLSKIIITASVLKLIDYEASRNMVAELLNSPYLFSLDFRRNEYAIQILDISNGRLVPRSSILAHYGLTNFADTKFLVDQLISIAKRAHDLASSDSIYFNIYVSLVNFSVIQAMIPESGKRDGLIRFYEGLKNLRLAVTHPHFWLQYALARLAYDQQEDLIKAKLYLDAAFSHARARPGYHLQHMENVLARYLLKSGKVETDINKAFDHFLEAHNIILRQSRNEKTEAPYKAASGYAHFYNAHKNELSIDQKKYISDAATEVISNIPGLSAFMRQEYSIRSCHTELTSIIRDISGGAI